MKILRSMAVLSLAGGMAFPFQVPDDPVMKARTQRAVAQGISEGDLPAVPRTITEPPPLPAPETNYKDTRRGRTVRAKRGKKARRGKARKHTVPRLRSKKHRG